MSVSLTTNPLQGAYVGQSDEGSLQVAVPPNVSSDFSSSTIASLPEKNEIESLVLSRILPTTTSALILGEASIPLIDLAAIDQSHGVLREELIKQFGDGLRDVGFIAIKAESLTLLIDRVNLEMSKYFSLPIEEKMKDWRETSQSGFSQEGRETAAGAKKADLKETFFIPPHYTDWPANRPEFKQVMEFYHGELTALASIVMGYISEYLKEPTEEVSKSVNSAQNLLRLAHYPAAKASDDPEAVWAGAHEDLNLLTLLPPSTVPGLQLMTKDGQWEAVNVPKGYLIVNTGEQLQSKTAGMIKATRHQVVNPGGEYAYQKRLASIFFASWSSDFSLKPFASCVNKITAEMSEVEKGRYLEQFPEVNVQENLLSRLIEMGVIPGSDKELVGSLYQKGLLRNPSEELIRLHPEMFAVK